MESPVSEQTMQPPLEEQTIQTPSSQKQQIFVRVARWIAVPLTFDLSTATTDDLLAEIEKMLVDHFTINHFDIRHDGELLRPGELLSDYNIQPGATVHLKYNPSGRPTEPLTEEELKVVAHAAAARRGTFDEDPSSKPSVTQRLFAWARGD
ncbi:hypothetical protein B0T21DRAFT_411225 [Apiosordaria backusii]|uniref:Ubiquitin-like domain-containing protein n=1 Tax=Apiosordaria backusii TaxID=314023 RepID=A0AA40BKQ2_9PEZI|nr:hypothetical protein B0T21DRAFT_411225 [Apiosordaria backusii]